MSFWEAALSESDPYDDEFQRVVGKISDQLTSYFNAQKNGWLFIVHSKLKDEAIKKSLWKFHLSIHPDSMNNALEVVKDFLSECDDRLAIKVLLPEHWDSLNDAENPQAGKMMVIYQHNEIDAYRLQTILTELNRRFVVEGIAPGQPVKNDRQVPGSTFLFYRSDQDAAGNYFEAINATSHNPSNNYDPFQEFLITQHAPGATIIPSYE
jgi:hypothetical protein